MKGRSGGKVGERSQSGRQAVVKSAASKQARLGWQSADQAQLSQETPRPGPERGASTQRRESEEDASCRASGGFRGGLARTDLDVSFSQWQRDQSSQAPTPSFHESRSSRTTRNSYQRGLYSRCASCQRDTPANRCVSRQTRTRSDYWPGGTGSTTIQ